MRFIIAAASALVAVAQAGTVPLTENASVYGVTVQYTSSGGVSMTAINVSAEEGNIFCQCPTPQWPVAKETWTCNNDSYTFVIHPYQGKTSARLRLYHSVGDDGRWGEVILPLVCQGLGGNLCVLKGPPNADFIMHYGDPPNWP